MATSGGTSSLDKGAFHRRLAGLGSDIGSESGIIEKSGAWYSYGGQRIGQGRENAKMFLKDNVAMMKEIEEKVKVVLGITKVEVPAEIETTEE